jgi:hypothetical protein
MSEVGQQQMKLETTGIIPKRVAKWYERIVGAHCCSLCSASMTVTISREE